MVQVRRTVSTVHGIHIDMIELRSGVVDPIFRQRAPPKGAPGPVEPDIIDGVLCQIEIQRSYLDQP